MVMEPDAVVTHEYVTGFGYAFFRKGDEFACAPLLADGSVDWESWTIVEECPEAEREDMQRLLRRLGFDETTSGNIITGIGWY